MSANLENNYGWHAEYMQIEELHAFSSGSTQKIALIDSGISTFQNERLIKNTEKNVYSRTDEYGHGTIMYSLIKGYKNEILGIAPDAEVVSLNVLSPELTLEPKIMADAIMKAIELECTVINLSLGSYQSNNDITKAINEAQSQGIIIVAATGDYSTDEMMFPANKFNVISAGSISNSLETSNFTNAPLKSTINLPGEGIKSLNMNEKIEYTSGTSQSSALLSGYIALIKDYAEKRNIVLTIEDLLLLLEEVKHSGNYLSVFKLILKE